MSDFTVKSFKGEYKVSFMDKKSGMFQLERHDFLVIDRYILNTYYKGLRGPNVFVVDVCEENKTIRQCVDLIDKLTDFGFKRNNKIFAIGGGVVQDIVSFTSSILYRGVDWVFLPTTLLAQCDSCIGSKTSINHNRYKNILGGFHPPKEIFIYRKFLSTLPDSDIRSGIGEMLHYFLLNHETDIATEMVNDDDILNNIEKYVAKSLEIKKEMIEKDEFDKGERNLFNYGHTFGHAIETLTEYEVSHGEAVTIGMIIANRLSLKKGLISKHYHDHILEILKKNTNADLLFRSLVLNADEDTLDEYIKCLKTDKKNVSNKLTCILLTETYGIKDQVEYEEVKEVLRK